MRRGVSMQRTRRQSGVSHTFTQCAKGSDGNVANGLLDGSKRSGKKTGKSHIVEADQSQVFGNPNADAGQSLQEFGGKVVISAEDGVYCFWFCAKDLTNLASAGLPE